MLVVIRSDYVRGMAVNEKSVGTTDRTGRIGLCMVRARRPAYHGVDWLVVSEDVNTLRAIMGPDIAA